MPGNPGSLMMPNSFPLSFTTGDLYPLKVLNHNSLHVHVLYKGKTKQFSSLMVCPCSLLSQQICNIRRLPAGKVIVTRHHGRSCNNTQWPTHGMYFLFFIKIFVDIGDGERIRGRTHQAREVRLQVFELWIQQEKH